MKRSLRNWIRNLVLAVFALSFFGFSACGNSGEPFTMDVTSTLIVSDASPSTNNPVQQIVDGTLHAQVTNEFRDRFELEIMDFEVDANFDGVGPITLVLDPNFASTATVFKLNRSNTPFGTNTMNLSLIVETPEQNLTLSQMSLSSDNATLELAQNLPTLNFFVGGQPKQFDLSALAIQIPVQLIVSTGDNQ